MPRPSWDTSRGEWENVAAAILATGRNPDGSIFTLPVTSAAAELAEAGAVWVASSRLAPGADQVAGFHFDNPAGSGLLVIILGIRAWSSVHIPIRLVRGATSTGAPMSVINSDLGVTAAPALTPTSGIGILTGGDIVGQGGVDPADHYQRNGPFRLPAGVSMAGTRPAPGGLTASANVAASVDYAIVPAA